MLVKFALIGKLSWRPRAPPPDPRPLLDYLRSLENALAFAAPMPRPVILPALDAALVDRVADRFRLLSDPTRLRILSELHAAGELSVGEIVARIDSSYATVSKQLALLRAHHTVARRREGTAAYYRIVDPSLEEVCTVVCRSLNDHWLNWGAELEAAMPGR
jgi:ArsR family transcriptional regulator